MKFKELRDKIFDECIVLLGTKEEEISTHEASKYDEYPVVGVRSRIKLINGFAANSYIEVLLYGSECGSNS